MEASPEHTSSLGRGDHHAVAQVPRTQHGTLRSDEQQRAGTSGRSAAQPRINVRLPDGNTRGNTATLHGAEDDHQEGPETTSVQAISG